MNNRKKWDERYEEIKKKHANADFNNPDNLKAFNDEVSQLFADYRNETIRNADRIIDNIVYCNSKLTDKLIVKLIGESGSLYDFLLIFTIMGSIIAGCALIYFYPNLFNEVLILYFIIPVVVFGIISFCVEKTRMNNAKIFAEKHYREAQLFKSEVDKVKCVFRPFTLEKRGFKYRLYFYDENDKPRDFDVSKSEFDKLKEQMNKKGNMNVYILKYPKYKRGYKYHVFYPEEKFENLSSIGEKSKNSVQ